jgi:hypothetical protein
MAQVRDDLQAEVVEVVEQARGLTDWKGLVARHPWIALTATAAVGFLIVPRRATPASSTKESVNGAAESGYAAAGTQAKGKRAAGVASPLLHAVAHAVVRGIMARVGQQVAGIVSGIRSADQDGVAPRQMASRRDASGDSRS